MALVNRLSPIACRGLDLFGFLRRSEYLIRQVLERLCRCDDEGFRDLGLTGQLAALIESNQVPSGHWERMETFHAHDVAAQKKTIR